MPRGPANATPAGGREASVTQGGPGRVGLLIPAPEGEERFASSVGLSLRQKSQIRNLLSRERVGMPYAVGVAPGQAGRIFKFEFPKTSEGRNEATARLRLSLREGPAARARGGREARVARRTGRRHANDATTKL